MITSNLSDPQKAFNAKMEGIRKVIERAVHSPVPDITDHITEQIRDILKDSFIPKSESKTEDTYVKCIAEIPEISNKRDVTVGKIYKVIESDDISFKLYDDKGNHYWFHKDYFIPAEVKPAETISYERYKLDVGILTDAVNDLDKRLTELENKFKPFGSIVNPKYF